jgi:hypothetical protein
LLGESGPDELDAEVAFQGAQLTVEAFEAG